MEGLKLAPLPVLFIHKIPLSFEGMYPLFEVLCSLIKLLYPLLELT